MTIRKASDGSVLSKTALLALTTEVVDPDPEVTVNEDIWQDFTIGEGTDPDPAFEGGRRRLFYAGQVVKTSTIDALFEVSDITSVTPNTGAAAGGTAVTIKGTNFAGATAVSFGGAAATLPVVVDDETITCVTPAHAAGAVDVVVTDDSGTATETGGYTYT